MGGRGVWDRKIQIWTLILSSYRVAEGGAVTSLQPCRPHLSPLRKEVAFLLQFPEVWESRQEGTLQPGSIYSVRPGVSLNLQDKVAAPSLGFRRKTSPRGLDNLRFPARRIKDTSRPTSVGLLISSENQEAWQQNEPGGGVRGPSLTSLCLSHTYTHQDQNCTTGWNTTLHTAGPTQPISN